MFTNRKMNLFLIGSLAVALIVVLALAVAPSAAAPPIIAVPYMDFAQRHPEMRNPSAQKAIGSDWYERHSELFQKIDSIDTSDYYLRHR